MVAAALPEPLLRAVAPPLLPGEAVSSWLARTAEAGLLTLGELEQELGASIGSADRGGEVLERAAALTNGSPAALQQAVHPALPSSEVRWACNAPEGWAVCRQCLRGDHEAGRPPHVRAAWTHPLVAVCLDHGAPLVPYGQSEVPIVNSETLVRTRAVRCETDHLLESLKGEATRELKEAARAVSCGRTPHVITALTNAVSDIVDALALQSELTRGPMLSLLGNRRPERLLRFHSTFRIPSGNMWRMNAADRLLYVRSALLVLSRPGDPLADAAEGDWLEDAYACSPLRHRRRSLEHAARDRLILLALHLPAPALQALDERSRNWPKHLRLRWTYAAAVGAFAGAN